MIEVPIADFYPPVEQALGLEPEELALFVLGHVNQLEETKKYNNILLPNYMNGTAFQSYAGEKTDDMLRAATEAWIWLERECLIAPDPKRGQGIVYVTKRGKKFLEQGDVNQYLKGQLIPKETLDPLLASKVVHLFLRGDYDTAVFQAFKEVEVRVRKAANLTAEFYGTELMREAFHSTKGVLTDATQLKGEREATAHLFAGAIGLFKNPCSHRDVNWDDPAECAELIYLANHLLRLVDRRAVMKAGS